MQYTGHQTTDDWRDRIVQDPGVLGGKPRIRDTRVSVELITDLVEGARSVDEIIYAYPFISAEDIEACVRYKATGAVLSYVTWAHFECCECANGQSGRRGNAR